MMKMLNTLKKILIFLIDLHVTFVTSLFTYFINLCWDIVYNIIIFIPFLFGKRKFSKLDKVIETLKNKTEITLIVAVAVVTIVCIINFVIPTSPLRVTKLAPESNVGTAEEKDKNSTENTEKESKDQDLYNNNEKQKGYEKYQNMPIEEINILDLKKENSDIVGWIRVDKTNINYPIVQSTDNEYYLNHSFNKTYNKNGSIFGDYRNDLENLKKNSIIYGHHLLNKTMFGTISNLFTKEWQENSSHLINLKTSSKIYNWNIFSIYEVQTETYYLANEFTSEYYYKEFIKTLKNRTIYDFNYDISNTTNILTLSTCNDNNTGRLVVHAALIN